MEADFSGYATKAGLKCSDGRTITPEAFKHMDGKQVPLVWQHVHNNPENILGHALLEARPDGMYAHGFFNDTKQGQDAKVYVQHKDIKAMSIYANKLVERAKQVLHGEIREVSLVLSPANPGAVIDFVRVAHGDGFDDEILDDEAVITTGLEFEHAAPTMTKTTKESSDTENGPTIQEIYDSLSQQQKDVVAYMVSAALESSDSVQQSAVNDDKEKVDAVKGADDITHQEGADGMSRNVFEQAKAAGGNKEDGKNTLSHSDVEAIFKDVQKNGGSLRAAIDDYAIKHGIENIESLFPDPKSITDTPEFKSRNMAWVQGVIDGTRKTPFSRIKSNVADITQAEARAKGYIKGNYKKEEWFSLTSRSTTPTTIYKKQKLDRDDILDVTDFDIVAWMKAEMRLMLMEEIARAILLGDGRDVGDDDKIKDPMALSSGEGIRSIINENELYATQIYVNLDDANSNYSEAVDEIMMASEYYKGSGSPTFYSTQRTINRMLLAKDGNLRRYYNNVSELAAAMNVSRIVAVEPMEDYPNLLGIIVNLGDYNVGTDRGGEVTLFDDFDIDYNQYKYLIETRFSGALTKIKSALIINKTAGTNVLVDPISAPTFVSSTGVVTIPTQTGVVYKNADTSATLTAGAQTALTAGETLNVKAIPASGYYFSATGLSGVDEWAFSMPAA